MEDKCVGCLRDNCDPNCPMQSVKQKQYMAPLPTFEEWKAIIKSRNIKPIKSIYKPNKKIMEIKCIGTNAYNHLILTHLHKELPQFPVKQPKQVLDIITDLLYNTKNFRYGSIPAPEFQVRVRQIVKKAIDNDKPIPVLVPFGSIKADFSPNLDIAELSALNILVYLDKQIRQFHLPGLQAAIRIEDTSGFELFKLEDNYDMIVTNSKRYSEDLNKLVRILSPEEGAFIPYQESLMVGSKDFITVEKELTEILYKYLIATKNMTLKDEMTSTIEFSQLKHTGWTGWISPEQRNHYLSQYSKLYRDYDENRLIRRLAMYFGGSLARFKTGLRGDLPEWEGDFIQLAFIPPIKGLPEGYNYNYLYYRTVQMNQSRTHLAPWRAKGYIQVQGRETSYKLTTFADMPALEKQSVLLADKGLSVEIRIDFLEV